MAVWIEPVTLDGEHVVLEPLTADHAEALADATADGELWKLWYTFVPAPDAVEGYIDAACAEQTEGGLAFAVRDRASDTVIGSTRFVMWMPATVAPRLAIRGMRNAFNARHSIPNANG